MQSKICPSTKSEAGNWESWHSFYENLTLQIIHVLWDWLRTGEDNRSRLVQWGKPKDHCLPSWMIPSSSETLLSSNSIKWACLHANTILMYLEFIQKRSLASKTAYLALLGVLSPGEGNGCPLQYSCLDNSMDRGTWWGGATIHGVTKSWTQLFFISWSAWGRRTLWMTKEKASGLKRLQLWSLWASQVVLMVKKKNPTANTRDIRDINFIPAGRRSPGEGHSNPLQYFCLENPMEEEPGRLQYIGSQRAGNDWSNSVQHMNTELPFHYPSFQFRWLKEPSRPLLFCYPYSRWHF